MPQIGWFEILIIVVVAILVIGPKDFPVVLKKIGNWIGSTKRYFIDIQNKVEKLDEEIEESTIEEKYSTKNKDNYQLAIHNFKQVFFEIQHQQRTLKHVSDPLKGSASKRINMFLRWMVRNDNTGVDLGIWKTHNPAHLHCPLDVHSGNVARKLGVLTRKQNDWKALSELDITLREFDVKDPVKYDFALFGLGVFEKF